MQKLIPLIVLAVATAGCSGGGGSTTEAPAPPPPPINQKVLFTEFVSSAVTVDPGYAEPLLIDQVDFDFSGAADETAYDDLLGQ